jgi:hypothetical protein
MTMFGYAIRVNTDAKIGRGRKPNGGSEVSVVSYEHRARRVPGVEFWGVLLLVAALMVLSLDAYAFATVL